jgi:hypothetical protein
MLLDGAADGFSQPLLHVIPIDPAGSWSDSSELRASGIAWTSDKPTLWRLPFTALSQHSAHDVGDRSRVIANEGVELVI